MMTGLALGQGNPRGMDAGDIGQFAVDQRGRYVVYQTEALPDNITFDAACSRLDVFLTAKGNTNATESNRLRSEGSVVMKKHAGIGNYVAGDLHYTLVVEYDNGEVKYWFTDLAYQPYRNDRYGKRIKATVSPIPLEQEMSKLNAGIWSKQRRYAYETLEALSDEIASQLKALGKPKVVNTTL